MTRWKKTGTTSTVCCAKELFLKAPHLHNGEKCHSCKANFLAKTKTVTPRLESDRFGLNLEEFYLRPVTDRSVERLPAMGNVPCWI